MELNIQGKVKHRKLLPLTASLDVVTVNGTEFTADSLYAGQTSAGDDDFFYGVGTSATSRIFLGDDWPCRATPTEILSLMSQTSTFGIRNKVHLRHRLGPRRFQRRWSHACSYFNIWNSQNLPRARQRPHSPARSRGERCRVARRGHRHRPAHRAEFAAPVAHHCAKRCLLVELAARHIQIEITRPPATTANNSVLAGQDPATGQRESIRFSAASELSRCPTESLLVCRISAANDWLKIKAELKS